MITYDFSNKVTLVTGGSNGIGKAISLLFKKSGAQVIVIDMLEPDFQCAYYHKADIANKSELEKFSSCVKEKFGSIDYLINNACKGSGGIKDCSYRDFLYTYQVCTASAFYLSQLFMNSFNNGASIVNIASTRAFASQENSEPYSSAKGALISLTHSMSMSLKSIARVNSISPGWINTQNEPLSSNDHLQHPSLRIGVPNDIAYMTLYLCSDQASFIHAQNITIDGGMSKQMIYSGDERWYYDPQSI